MTTEVMMAQLAGRELARYGLRVPEALDNDRNTAAAQQAAALATLRQLDHGYAEEYGDGPAWDVVRLMGDAAEIRRRLQSAQTLDNVVRIMALRFYWDAYVSPEQGMGFVNVLVSDVEGNQYETDLREQLRAQIGREWSIVNTGRARVARGSAAHPNWHPPALGAEFVVPEPRAFPEPPDTCVRHPYNVFRMWVYREYLVSLAQIGLDVTKTPEWLTRYLRVSVFPYVVSAVRNMLVDKRLPTSVAPIEHRLSAQAISPTEEEMPSVLRACGDFVKWVDEWLRPTPLRCTFVKCVAERPRPPLHIGVPSITIHVRFQVTRYAAAAPLLALGLPAGPLSHMEKFLSSMPPPR